ncbi:MAG: TetR/AcrR family transcriptional regulator [Aeromicrobium sp.]|nr:MAG: TetR/AcrR family transcriptional regulator [Aeromicrobium sp.]
MLRRHANLAAMDVEERRALRTRAILDATRELFETRGTRDTQIEDIANAVGVNRAIIYRHFSSKEEIFAMTLVDYLAELEARFAAARDSSLSPEDELRSIAGEFLSFGMEHDAFVDCAQALLRFRGQELFKEIEAPALVELGAAMNRCFEHLVEVFLRGTETGAFRIVDPYLLANVVYTQGLGFLNLVHFQKSVVALGSGEGPMMVDLPIDRVLAIALDATVAIARIAFDEKYPV